VVLSQAGQGLGLPFGAESGTREPRGDPDARNLGTRHPPWPHGPPSPGNKRGEERGEWKEPSPGNKQGEERREWKEPSPGNKRGEEREEWKEPSPGESQRHD